MRPVKVMKFVAHFGLGGTERQFVNLGLALEPSRFAVQFGCLRLWGELLEEVDARGIPVHGYNVCTFRNPKALGAQLQLARDIRRNRIEIVHAYNYYANVFAIPAAKLAGARVVASIRDMGAYLSTTQRHVQRFVCGLADRILVNANAIKDWLVSDGYPANRITVIPNGIDLSRFEQPVTVDSLHNEFHFRADAPLIGVVGRVKPLKGIEDFLRAASIVSTAVPQARFLIIGDGFVAQGRNISRDDAYHQDLLQLIAQLGLRDRVAFTGFRTVEHVLPQLSVSVLPSLTEGLSNALLESMAAGLPVVATRVGGTSEVVTDGENGMLVAARDPESLANSICRLLETPALATRLGQAARRSVTDRYSMQRLAMNTSRFYESLLAA
jgi:glycosyltransferase involved in cell wall biosynthesis